MMSVNKQQIKSEKREEKKFLLDYIDCYRSLTALWDSRIPDYNDRLKKERQYKILVQKYQERYPDADRKEATRRINMMRSNFKREMRRIKQLERNGFAEEDLKERKLWYFDALSFIEDVKTQKESCSEPEEDEAATPAKKKYQNDVVDDESRESQTDELISLVADRLRQPTDVFQKATEVWAFKLKNMDPNQSIFAEKLINDVIYYGQLGQLNFNTMLLMNTADAQRSFNKI